MMLGNASYKTLYSEVRERHAQQQHFTSSDFETMSDDQHHHVLIAAAEIQRGGPETAMNRVQEATGGGLLGSTFMHVGDIYHRAHEWGSTGRNVRGDARDKINKVHYQLTYPYGFEREAGEQLHNNLNMEGGNPHATWGHIKVLGEDYAKEHAKLPSYTHVGHLAKAASIHLGKLRFGATAGVLERLKDMGNEGMGAHFSRQASIDFMRTQE